MSSLFPAREKLFSKKDLIKVQAYGILFCGKIHTTVDLNAGAVFHTVVFRVDAVGG
ncbi:MAG: hypothetical protein A8274_584 [Halanaerobium sp. 4-GBenrich]|jgi:hypothetical protein|uniref:Uncharacterized protein n=1 Tax=Halanaerobium congolense TaxID=54121 RepID=A0A1M7GUW5_9FIRM|nr:hypothetical protein [Halanaerobium congolense]ODS50446.1 MAG: hypothetical protein A8274_584 [Halanaerobium sp. 4-GBenrich]TDP27154.1 hypothetical protein C8C79_101145 [Halanaerobium congolense]TDS33670.1 hypothetical protein BY453_10456 [Halanaerobium congolense]SHM20162.1 hypothetical protein SAMN04515650_101120 [Halanaerobium congolense]